MLSEAARQILAEQELSLGTLRADVSEVDRYQNLVFDRQIEQEQGKNNFVSDRSVIDCLAYSSAYGSCFRNQVRRLEKEHGDYLDKLRSKNTFVFFIRPNKETLKADGVREDPIWEGIIAIDAKLKLLLDLFDIRYFQIDTANMQERCRIVSSVLSLS